MFLNNTSITQLVKPTSESLLEYKLWFYYYFAKVHLPQEVHKLVNWLVSVLWYLVFDISTVG